MHLPYSLRLIRLYRSLSNETPDTPPENLSFNELEQQTLFASTYLAAYLTVKAIRYLGRTPLEERESNFDMLGVYQCFANMNFVFLSLPLGQENIQPSLAKGSAIIGKALFSELPDEGIADCIESGARKLELIFQAKQEYLIDFRERLERAVIAYVVAHTDEASPVQPGELIPVFGALINVLCETFARDI